MFYLFLTVWQWMTVSHTGYCNCQVDLHPLTDEQVKEALIAELVPIFWWFLSVR